MADRPLIDLWKWLGYEDKEKDRESARRVKESADIYSKQREADTTAALARDKASYETKRQRFLEAHVNANRDNPDAVGLAESANRDWAKAVASESMPGVENYITSTARQPGLAKNAQETQRAETGKATVLANKAEGQAELASAAGDRAIRKEIATDAATTATETNKFVEATAAAPFKAVTGAEKAKGEQKDIFDADERREAAKHVSRALDNGAATAAVEQRDLTLQALRNQAKQGGALAGLAGIQYDIGAGTKDKLMESTAAKLNSDIAVYDQLSKTPAMKYPNYNPFFDAYLENQRRLGGGGGGVWDSPGQPAGDTTATRSTPRPKVKGDMDW